MKIMKKFWFDKETGEFNWAIVAIFALAAIFFFNVFTASVNIPAGTDINTEETVQDLRPEKNILQ